MTASLAADGVVSLVPALAIMLGANVGTTLIVQLLSFDISAVAPVLFIIGLVTFRVGGSSLPRAIGRIAIGLGLVLLALHILLDTLAPAEQAPAVRALLASITNDPILCIIIAAALTWAAHSSVAVVLLVMSLAFSQFVTPEAALALVLGANLGSAINPLIEGGVRGDPASRRLPVGNLLNRLVGILIAVPFLHPIAQELSAWQPDAAKMTAEFHMLFNVALAAISSARSMPWPGSWCACCRRRSGRTTLRCRVISTTPRWKTRRWRSPMRRARRCAWATPSRPCCATS